MENYNLLWEQLLSGTFANFDQKPERFTKAIYGTRALEIRVDLYLRGPIKTFQVLEDLAREPLSERTNKCIVFVDAVSYSVMKANSRP